MLHDICVQDLEALLHAQLPEHPLLPELDPAATFNASATRFSVQCSQPTNPKFTATDAAAGSGDAFVTLSGTYDVPGRGSVGFAVRLVPRRTCAADAEKRRVPQDILYLSGEGPFGRIRRADLALDRLVLSFTQEESFVRFPATYNVSDPRFAGAPLVPFDEDHYESGIADDLANTIFFYVLRFNADAPPLPPVRTCPPVEVSRPVVTCRRFKETTARTAPSCAWWTLRRRWT